MKRERDHHGNKTIARDINRRVTWYYSTKIFVRTRDIHTNIILYTFQTYIYNKKKTMLYIKE